MARTNEKENTNTQNTAPVRGSVESLSVRVPPVRRKANTVTVPGEIVAAIVAQIDGENWLSNGEVYEGETAQNDAQRDAKIYRRDVARALKTKERTVRTRVWENTDDTGEEDGTWSFGLKLRGDSDSDVEADDEGGQDVPEDNDNEDGKEAAA
jgi:hypothetical protein